MSDLVDRLRGIYRVPITDGLGPAGGDEPDNPKEFVSTFQTPPIHHEAAAEIERLRARAETAEAALREATEWRSMESAPRDETPILVGRPGYFPEVYRWRSDILGCAGPWLIPMPGEDGMRLKPTAWLPVPNPEAGQ